MVEEEPVKKPPYAFDIMSVITTSCNQRKSFESHTGDLIGHFKQQVFESLNFPPERQMLFWTVNPGEGQKVFLLHPDDTKSLQQFFDEAGLQEKPKVIQVYLRYAQKKLKPGALK